MSLKDGNLTVEANNSDMTQILQKVAAISGMTIDGLDKSAPVFGEYGPGNPRDVLTDLLVGSGYNFMMVGHTADGAPRELLLTAKDNHAPAPPAKPGPSAPVESDSPQPGPGAVVPTPQSLAQDSEDSATRQQQNMQRLEQLHEQQQQQKTPQ